MTVILDYGMGNLRSVERALRALGADPAIQTDLRGATRLIIPGVGAFGAAMERIGPLAPAIREFAAAGHPVLGICLGMQLLFEQSEELGEFAGLGLVPGQVRYLVKTEGIKIPHMGWNQLEIRQSEGLHSGISTSEQVYFVHSLYCDPVDSAVIASTSDHGITFPATIQKGKIWGTQFHPEKSGAPGLRMLQNFLSC